MSRAVALALVVFVAFGSTPADAKPVRTVLVDVAADGTQANAQFASQYDSLPRLSRDGRYAAFSTHATNLAPNNGTARMRSYRKDLSTGAVVQIDLNAAGNDRSGVDSFVLDMSDDARYVLYELRDTGGFEPKLWFVRDVVAATTTRAPDHALALSDDGALALVAATSSRIVDLHTGAKTAVPKKALAMSGDGRRVVVQSDEALAAGGTPGTYLYDIATRQAWELVDATNCTLAPYSMDAHGDTVAFDVSNGGQAPERAMVFDAAKGAIEPLPPVDDQTGDPNLSADGRTVTFTSVHDEPFAADQWVFDRRKGEASVVATNIDGGPPHSTTGVVAVAFGTMSGDGRYVVYLSNADDLVVNDTNNVPDIFRTRVG